MAKRVTIMIDDDLDRQIRSRQASRIARTSTSVSYSGMLGEVLRKGLKK